MSEDFDRSSILAGLDSMARQIDWALTFDVESRRKSGLETTDDTHLMSPPVWPSHGCLKNWVKALNGAHALLAPKADPMTTPNPQEGQNG